VTFTPFDFNEAIHQRREHAREGLRYGSPVVGVSCEEALAVLTVRRSQRQVFEIYDRLIYSAIGNQSDIEAVRLGAVDVAAREGFERSPDDVTAQRLVGFALSPALKEVFRDQFRAPSVIRALFGELGDSYEEDLFYVLNYDGEFSVRSGKAVVAGSVEAEDAMYSALDGLREAPALAEAMPAALRAWAIGSLTLRTESTPEEDDEDHGFDDTSIIELLHEELKQGRPEIGLLERKTDRHARFRLLPVSEVNQLVSSVAPFVLDKPDGK